MADQRLSLIIEAVDHATKTLNKIEKETQGLSVVSAAAFLSIAKVAVEATEKIIEFGTAGLLAADRINDLAKSTGISVETLSSLKLELEKSGSNMEDLANASKILVAKMSDAASGSEEAAVGFKTFGISVKNTDGSLRSLESILPEIADAVAKGRNETERMAIAQEFLGKKADALVPFLSRGAAGFKDAMEKAKELGIVLTGEAAAGADKFADSMADTKAQVEALSLKIGTALLPTIAETLGWWQKATAAVLGYFSASTMTESQVLKAALAFKESRGSVQDYTDLINKANAAIGTQAQVLRSLNPKSEELIRISKVQAAAQREVGDARAFTLIGLLQAVEKEVAAEQAALEKKKATEAGKRTEVQGTSDLFGRLAKKRVEEENKAAFDIAIIQAGSLVTAQARLDAELVAIKIAVDKKVITESEGNIKIASSNEKFRQSEFQARQEQVGRLTEIGAKLTDIALSEEGKRGNMLKAMVKEQVREYIKAQIRMALGGVAARGGEEVGKAAIAAPLSFGATLLAIPLIAGAILAAESVINAIPFAKGGLVTGGTPGRDSVPAMLMPGEAVLPKNLVDAVIERGAPGPSSGGITFTGDLEIFGNRRYIELVAEELSKLVQFQGGTLVASRTSA